MKSRLSVKLVRVYEFFLLSPFLLHRKNKLKVCSQCSNWTVIHDAKAKEEATRLVQDLIKASASCGFILSSPAEVRTLTQTTNQAYVQAITDVKSAQEILQVSAEIIKMLNCISGLGGSLRSC